MRHEHRQPVAEEWVSFPGGELEGRRPKALCPACREALKREASAAHARGKADAPRPLCFQCYRADLERERKLREAGQLNTGSDARFQTQLPFEAIDKPRLEMLKAERTLARAVAIDGTARFADKRRHAQIAARHALHAIGAGLKARELAAHMAELQLPESWLPFVVGR